MAFKMKTSEKVQGSGDSIKKRGWFHLSVVNIDENPLDKKQAPLDGFRVEFSVLSGTEPSEVSKVLDKVFFNPNITKDQNSQEWAMRKQTALLIATGLITEAQLGQDLEVELQDAVGRQVVMHIERDDYQSGKANMDIFDMAWADVLHVDDPRVAEQKVPLNADAIKLLPPAQRRDPKSFDLEKLTGRKQVAANGSNGSASRSNGSHAPAAKAPVVDVDDI